MAGFSVYSTPAGVHEDIRWCHKNALLKLTQLFSSPNFKVIYVLASVHVCWSFEKLAVLGFYDVRKIRENWGYLLDILIMLKPLLYFQLSSHLSGF